MNATAPSPAGVIDFDGLLARLRGSEAADAAEAAAAIEALIQAIREADDGLGNIEGTGLCAYSSHWALVAILNDQGW